MNVIMQEQRAQFAQDGFFVLENVFSTEEMEALEAAIDRHTLTHNDRLREGEQGGISRADEIQFTAFLAEHDEAICTFATQEKMAAVAVALLGPDVRLYWNQAV